ncbi:MAG: glucosamine-6-phosphate deaminase [Chitinophagaceae bacterium]|nr:glucosamine-6-phosphate deaminase [Chitinophagaceae bacterium]
MKAADLGKRIVFIAPDPGTMGIAAGKAAANGIRNAIDENGTATIILATGTSQFETLKQLTAEPIDWGKVVMFHLDEYIGLPISSGASFRRYLKERFIDKVSPLKAVHLIDAELDPVAECKRLATLIAAHPVDIALVGIGENGHLAFNDPPADFSTDDPYIIVSLDDACRKQQMGEGWFASMDAVPTKAISMSIRQILRSEQIICSVPDMRKAEAVKNSLEGPVSEQVPASILRQHSHCSYYLDEQSARLLSPQTRVEAVQI